MNFWNYLAESILNLYELKIWQKKDRQGNCYWEVYNPKTNKHYNFNSEQEVRFWLDQSYYQ